MGVPCKGLQHLLTLSGAVGAGSHSKERHIHYFKIGSLELERARRKKERQTASKRIIEIDARLQEIDEEIRGRQAQLCRTDVGKVQKEQVSIPTRAPHDRSRRKTLRY